MDEEIPVLNHDITLDYMVTADEVIRCPARYPAPAASTGELLTEEKIAEIPALQKQREAHLQESRGVT